MTPKANVGKLSFQALKLVQNKHTFYFATIPIDDLFNKCFISQREKDPIIGFQRELNEGRAAEISQYLTDGPGSIPSNIVLSAQENALLKYNSKTKLITIANTESCFLVLDGQHRLWGYQKCSVRHRVPVAIYQGLTRAEEARLFIDINTTQRGVSAALLLDIKQLAQIEDAKEAMLRSYFDRLYSDAKSPLAGKLSAAQSIAGKVSRVTFNRALSTILTHNVLQDSEPKIRYQIILNYLNAFDAELQDKKLLTRSAFFEAIFEVFDAAINKTLALKKNVKQESIQTIIAPLANLGYTGTGTRALLDKKRIVELMQSTLSTSTPISAEMV